MPLADGGADTYIAQDKFHHQFTGRPARAAERAHGRHPARRSSSALAKTPLRRSVTSWFIFGQLDRNIPAAATASWPSGRTQATVEVAGASHVVGVSHPVETAKLVLQGAAARSRQDDNRRADGLADHVYMREVEPASDDGAMSSGIPSAASSTQTYEQVPVAAAPAVTVRHLRGALRARGVTEYAVVDHGHDMAAAGAPSHPAWTLVFGNPVAGEKLLARDLAAAVDIPMRLAVIGTGSETSAIVLRPMESLLPTDLSDVAAGFTGVLRSLASEARDAAERAAP